MANLAASSTCSRSSLGHTKIRATTSLSGPAELTVNLIMTGLIVLVLVYTIMGGMVSVIITDYVQFVVLSAGMALGIYFCMTHPDLGWSNMTAAMAEHGETSIALYDYTPWTQVTAGVRSGRFPRRWSTT